MDWKLERNKIMRLGKNSGPVLSRLWAKVHKITRQCRRSFVLSNAHARLSLSRFVQQIFAIKSRYCLKIEQMLNFLAPFFREGRPRLLYGRLLVRITVRRLAKFGLSSVCWSLSAKPGNEVECRIYRGWVKTHFQFEAVCGPKFMLFWDDAGDPL